MRVVNPPMLKRLLQSFLPIQDEPKAGGVSVIPPSGRPESYRLAQEKGWYPVFAIGTGRSGTHFLQEIMGHDPAIASYHLPDPDNDSFVEYCAWNNLPVDIGGFLQTRRDWIAGAAEQSRIYFESNPYMSFSVEPLFHQLNAKFFHMVRNPAAVVNSHFVKGWYEKPLAYDNPQLALGAQPGTAFNHFLGRLTPRGEEFERWQRLTRIGKIAWMWNAVQMRVLSETRQLPPEHVFSCKLEDVEYRKYVEMHKFVGGQSPLDEPAFLKITQSRPGKAANHRNAASWSEKEREEFLEETKDAVRALEYDLQL